jgi:hypothetical protein
VTRLALAAALVACALSGAALAVAIGNAPPPSRYSLVCSGRLDTARGYIPVLWPCAEGSRP